MYIYIFNKILAISLSDASSADVHTRVFTQRSVYTEKRLHTGVFTLTSVYRQELLHRSAFTHRSFYTEER